MKSSSISSKYVTEQKQKLANIATIAQNRITIAPFNSKSTEKNLDNENKFICTSSIKKSERSHQKQFKQNLGSLIFETPPKGTESRSYLKIDASKFFEDEILGISPTPFKAEEDYQREEKFQDRQDQMINYMSPSKFLWRSGFKYD